MIKALVFDLDNTLIDRQKAFIKGLFEILKEYYQDEELINEMIKDILVWDNYGAVARIEAFHLWEEKYHPNQLTPEIFDEAWKKKSGKEVFLYDDVIETLTILKKKYSLILLSNGESLSQRRKITSTGIADFFDYILVSGEYECSKPDRRIFDYVANKMGFKNEECVYIGDTYKIDVLGSRNAGYIPVYIDRRNEAHDDVKTIYSLKELTKIY